MIDEENRIRVGAIFRYAFKISSEDVKAFIKLSGDDNLIHADIDAAKASPIKMLCVPGMLPALMFSRVLGTMFPGHGTIYRFQNLKFPNPSFIDREYVVQIEVIRVLPQTHSAIVRTRIRDEGKGLLCIDGVAKITHNTKL